MFTRMVERLTGIRNKVAECLYVNPEPGDAQHDIFHLLGHIDALSASYSEAMRTAEMERDRAREAALEEAARRCDEFAAATLTMYQNGNKRAWFTHNAALDLAQDIRALKPTQAPER